MRGLVTTILSVVWAIVLALVGGRFLALLVNANRDSEIVQRLYRHSDFWVKPFFDIFHLSNQAVNGGGTFEPASLIAFLFYAVAGALILGIVSGAPLARYRWA